MKSEHCNPAITQIADALLNALPDTKQAIVVNANHFLITSHALQRARLLSSHFAGFA